MKITSKYLAPISTIVLLFALWQLAVMLFNIPSWVLPSPIAVINDLIQSWHILLPHIWQTTSEVLLGLIMAIFFALACASLFEIYPCLRNFIYPLLVFSQTLPIIVLAPLLAIWFGFGILPKLLVVSLFCFFPLAINISDGFSSVRHEVTDLMTSINASRWKVWWKVKVPFALPLFFSGLKISATYSVMAAVVGEWVGGEKGLGIYLLRVSASFQLEKVFTVILIISSMSLIAFSLTLLLERITIPWHFYKQTNNE